MILVTGGGGFIGSVLVPTLIRNGHKVRVLDSLMYTGEGLLPSIGALVDFYKGDVRDAEHCIEALKGVDAVIHLAAIVGEKACKEQPEAAKEINYYATRQLWEVAKDAGVKNFIFASTCSNYGISNLATERTELKPLGLYAETKVEAERWLLEQSSDMCTVILRFATAFGISPRMRFDLLINEFVLDAYLHHRLSIYNANAQRPYCHVRDIAFMVSEVLRLISTFKGFDGEVFNIGGFNRSKAEIAAIIKRHVPCLSVDTVETGDIRDYRVGFGKIHGYGIMPVRPIEIEIERMLCSMSLFDDVSARKWVNA